MVFHNFISAILQIALFAFIPFIFFLFRKDKSTGYLKYIGFTEPTSKSIVYVCVVATLIAITGIFLILINEGFKQALLSPPSITGQFRQEGMSFNTVCSLLIMACLKTSLSEEILFRGFLAKQLIIKLGFKIGNLIQAAIFGLMHYLLFWKIAHFHRY